ncbi:MAG: hypothetical protein IJH41_04375 [Eubacterium sp.]|nr:hypothetical protein [Eubacterium sp.]
MREWQQTKFKDLVMPDTVYYETIWAVRDLYRMEQQLEILKNEISDGALHTTSVVSDIKDDYEARNPTEEKVMQKAALERRVRAINDALNTIPLAYRQFVLDNIILQKSYNCFPNKFWRIWKQRFLYNVARNLFLV